MYRYFASVLFLLSAACGGTDGSPSATVQGGQTGAETNIYDPPCIVDSEDSVALDDMTDLGFSASEAISNISDEREAGWHWADNAETTLRVTVSAASQGATMMTLRPKDSGIEIACLNELKIPITLSLESDDGLLDESWDIDLSAQHLELLSASKTLMSADFSSFNPASVQPDIEDGETVSFAISWEPQRITASMSGEPAPQPSTDPESPVTSVDNVQIGWTDSLEE